MAGWIKIYRELQDHWLSQDMEKLGRWISLLLMATHEDTKILVGGQMIELKRGQFVASNSFLAEKWNTSESSVLRFLKLLESDSMLNRCTNRKVTIITICNYDSYQERNRAKRTDTRTENRTDGEPMMNQSRTENKNVKEDKEIYNTNSAHTREGNISWIASVENGYRETFKGKGAAIPLGSVVGKPGKEVLALLDVYMALREVKGIGHKDYNEFVNLFKWHIESGKIKVHEKPSTGKKAIEAYG